MNREQARLSICLLGTFRVTLDGEPVTDFVSDKARALLAFLAVEADYPHRRERLAGMLWPDYPEKDARTSLRTALANVRKVVGDREADPRHFDVSRQAVQFNRESDSWIDVSAFTARWAAGQASPETDPHAISQLEEAVGWYQGDFLEGFSPADCLLFEEWALSEQELLRRQAWEALEHLVTWFEGNDKVERALPYARRQIDLDPLRESAHRHVMRLLALSGQRAAALRHYDICSEMLKAELGVEPDSKTTQLYEQIRDGTLEQAYFYGFPLPPASVTSAHQGTDPSLHSPGTKLLPGTSEGEVHEVPEEQHAGPEPLRLRLVVWVLRVLLTMGIAITLIELFGLSFKGLRFLGGAATQPQLTMAAVVAVALVLWTVCGYVLLGRQRFKVAGRRAQPAFDSRERVAAGFVFVLNVVVTLLLVFGVLRYDVASAQSVAEGQLGILVAEFGQGVDMKNSTRGRELSAFVARSLRRELDLQPELVDDVVVISGPLVRSEEQAVGVANESGAALVIWGWVPETVDDTFVPSFTFAESPEIDLFYSEALPWHEVEISAGGTLELSQTVARRTSGLIEYVLGLVHLNRGEYDTASIRFQEAITLLQREAQAQSLAAHEVRSVNRSLAVYHVALGRSFAAQDNPERARIEYETALEYDSLYGRTYIGMGNIGYSQGQCAEALQWYEMAIQLAPEARKATALYARGNAHYCLQRYELAAADYQQAIRHVDPADPSLDLYHLVLGVTLCWLGRFSEGAKEIQQSQILTAPDIQSYKTSGLEWCWSRATAVAVPAAPTPSPQPSLSRTEVPTPSPTAQVPTLTATSTPTPSAALTLSPTVLLSVSPTPTVTSSVTLPPSLTPTPSTLPPTEPPPPPTPEPSPPPTLPPPSPPPTLPLPPTPSPTEPPPPPTGPPPLT